MSNSYELPAFVSPLTDEEHAQLGRIAVLWGQADWLIDELMLVALSLSRKQRETLIGEKPLGPKLDLLAKHLDDIPHSEAREAAKGIHARLNKTKTQRNHAFHVIWGWRANPRSKTIERCSRHPKALHNPIRVEDLPDLERTLCEAVTQGIIAVFLLRGQTPEASVVRFLHGKDKDAPDWFRRWAEQHPLLDRNHDPSWKPGQLPRLADPMK